VYARSARLASDSRRTRPKAAMAPLADGETLP
jgi:hypothetical protein